MQNDVDLCLIFCAFKRARLFFDYRFQLINVIVETELGPQPSDISPQPSYIVSPVPCHRQSEQRCSSLPAPRCCQTS